MRVIKCSSISDAYYKGVRYVLDNGYWVTTNTQLPNGQVDKRTMLQADQVTLNMRIDNDDIFSDLGPLGPAAAQIYVDEFLNPIKGDHPYTYGERLMKYRGEIDQIQYIINTLRKDPWSRQAKASIWDPTTDTKLPDPPCFQEFQAFQTNNGLCFADSFRSNDFYGALLYNLSGLYSVCITIARALQTPVFELHHTAIAPHIYKHNYDEVKAKWDNYKK